METKYLNVGNILADTESLRASRNANALGDMQVANARKYQSQTPEREQAQANMLKGDLDAGRKLAVLDPDLYAKTSKMSSDELTQMSKVNRAVATEYASIMEAPPEQRADMYGQMLSRLPPQVASTMPPQYDENQINLGLAKATAFDDFALNKALETEREFTNPQNVQTGVNTMGTFKKGKQTGEFEYTDPRIDTLTKRLNDALTKGGGKGLDSADENYIKNFSASYFKHFKDPQSGEITITDEKQSSYFMSIVADATEIKANNPSMTLSKAVTKSFENSGRKLLPFMSKEMQKRYDDAKGDEKKQAQILAEHVAGNEGENKYNIDDLMAF